MSIADDMAAAASGLLGALTDEQRRQAQWSFPSDSERRLWFYTPTDHGGLPLTSMDSAQQRRVFQLLASGLSTAGYVTASAIIGLENVLDQLEGFTVGFDRLRGRDPLLYWVAIFGEPTDRAWGWRFGGHHVSLHFTVVDGTVVSTTPCFFGADPASSPLLGPHLHRPLAGVEDLGRELVRSLDAEQAAVAVVASVPPVDLVSVNRAELSEGDRPLPLPLIWRGRFEGELDRALAVMQQQVEEALGLEEDHLEAVSFSRVPKGLSARDMRSDQREILRELLGTYINRIDDELAGAELAKIEGDGVDRLHFVWAGDTEPGHAHYYRVQGGDLFAEYDNTQRGANHIHSVWRDLSFDFGGDPLATHYADAEGHHGH